MDIEEVYKKYKHLDSLLSFQGWEILSLKDQIMLDLWQVVKQNNEMVKCGRYPLICNYQTGHSNKYCSNKDKCKYKTI